MEILEFVKLDDMDPLYFDSPLITLHQRMRA